MGARIRRATTYIWQLIYKLIFVQSRSVDIAISNHLSMSCLPAINQIRDDRLISRFSVLAPEIGPNNSTKLCNADDANSSAFEASPNARWAVAARKSTMTCRRLFAESPILHAMRARCVYSLASVAS